MPVPVMSTRRTANHVNIMRLLIVNWPMRERRREPPACRGPSAASGTVALRRAEHRSRLARRRDSPAWRALPRGRVPSLRRSPMTRATSRACVPAPRSPRTSIIGPRPMLGALARSCSLLCVAVAGCGGAPKPAGAKSSDRTSCPPSIEHEACDDNSARREKVDTNGDGKPDIVQRHVGRARDLPHGRPEPRRQARPYIYYDANGAASAGASRTSIATARSTRSPTLRAASSRAKSARPTSTASSTPGTSTRAASSSRASATRTATARSTSGGRWANPDKPECAVIASDHNGDGKPDPDNVDRRLRAQRRRRPSGAPTPARRAERGPGRERRRRPPAAPRLRRAQPPRERGTAGAGRQHAGIDAEPQPEEGARNEQPMTRSRTCALGVLAARFGVAALALAAAEAAPPASQAAVEGRARKRGRRGLRRPVALRVRGRADREASETAGPGAVQPNVRRVYQMVGTGESMPQGAHLPRDRHQPRRRQGRRPHLQREGREPPRGGRHQLRRPHRHLDHLLGGPPRRRRSSTPTSTASPTSGSTTSAASSRASSATRTTTASPTAGSSTRDGKLERMGVDVDFDGHVDRWDHDELARARRGSRQREIVSRFVSGRGRTEREQRERGRGRRRRGERGQATQEVTSRDEGTKRPGREPALKRFASDSLSHGRTPSTRPDQKATPAPMARLSNGGRRSTRQGLPRQADGRRGRGRCCGNEGGRGGRPAGCEAPTRRHLRSPGRRADAQFPAALRRRGAVQADLLIALGLLEEDAEDAAPRTRAGRSQAPRLARSRGRDAQRPSLKWRAQPNTDQAFEPYA